MQQTTSIYLCISFHGRVQNFINEHAIQIEGLMNSYKTLDPFRAFDFLSLIDDLLDTSATRRQTHHCSQVYRAYVNVSV